MNDDISYIYIMVTFVFWFMNVYGIFNHAI